MSSKNNMGNMKSIVNMTIDSDILQQLRDQDINRSHLFQSAAKDYLSKSKKGNSCYLELKHSKKKNKELELEIVRLKKRVNSLIGKR